jgi:hypothetical protein
LLLGDDCFEDGLDCTSLDANHAAWFFSDELRPEVAEADEVSVTSAEPMAAVCCTFTARARTAEYLSATSFSTCWSGI